MTVTGVGGGGGSGPLARREPLSRVAWRHHRRWHGLDQVVCGDDVQQMTVEADGYALARQVHSDHVSLTGKDDVAVTIDGAVQLDRGCGLVRVVRPMARARDQQGGP